MLVNGTASTESADELPAFVVGADDDTLKAEARASSASGASGGLDKFKYLSTVVGFVALFRDAIWSTAFT